MVDRTDAQRHSVAIRGATEALLIKFGWHPKAAARDAQAFAKDCEAALVANRHGDPGERR